MRLREQSYRNFNDQDVYRQNFEKRTKIKWSKNDLTSLALPAPSGMVLNGIVSGSVTDSGGNGRGRGVRRFMMRRRLFILWQIVHTDALPHWIHLHSHTKQHDLTGGDFRWMVIGRRCARAWVVAVGTTLRAGAYHVSRNKTENQPIKPFYLFDRL